MSALRKTQPAGGVVYDGEIPAAWAVIIQAAPQLGFTMLTYLDQLKVSLRPSSVTGAGTDLRIFAGFVIGHDPTLDRVGDIERHHIEAFKIWQRAQPGIKGPTFAVASFRRRLTHLRMFFIRITEWDWDDAPARVPIFFGDIPKRDESLPKFLDDDVYIRFMRSLTEEPHLHRRVAVELLARTGMRVGELCDLEADAVTIIGGAHWLRIPVGKLHNDRYVPLHPELVTLLDTLARSDGPRHPGRLLAGAEGPLNRHAVTRWVNTVARRAGIGHVHPHQLRHTLATQAINRGMSLEAIAALLGHKSLDMTRNYARIANRVVADEYAAVTAKVEALYTTTLPAEAEGPNMTLGRAGEPGGIEFWTDQLDTEARSRATVLLNFAESPENVERSGTTPPSLGPFNGGLEGPWTCTQQPANGTCQVGTYITGNPQWDITIEIPESIPETAVVATFEVSRDGVVIQELPMEFEAVSKGQRLRGLSSISSAPLNPLEDVPIDELTCRVVRIEGRASLQDIVDGSVQGDLDTVECQAEPHDTFIEIGEIVMRRFVIADVTAVNTTGLQAYGRAVVVFLVDGFRIAEGSASFGGVEPGATANDSAWLHTDVVPVGIDPRRVTCEVRDLFWVAND